MSFMTDQLPTVYAGRGLAGSYGARPYSVKLVFEWSDPNSGQGGLTRTEIPIVEANGQPPRFTKKKGENIPFGNAPGNIFEVGPITPLFSGGGTDYTHFSRELDESMDESRFIVVSGPGFADERFRIIDHSFKPLRIMLTVQAESEALDGLT